jgi:transposase
MSRVTPFPDITEEKIYDLQHRAKTKREFQRVQCLYFRQHGVPSTDIAPAMAMSSVSVKRFWRDFASRGEEAIFDDRRGGRYNENMTAEEEKTFLAPFFATAAVGGMLVVSEVQKAYEKKIGRRVGNSTIYDLLHRHGWRKIAPRPSHPKGDPVKREKFKTVFPPHRKAGRA